MKIVLIGANGTIGKNIKKALAGNVSEIIEVGKTSGQYQVDITKPQSLAALFKTIGKFDAVINASGDVAFAPVDQLSSEQWQLSLSSKLMGQINIAQQALPYLNPNGSITLTTGILGEEQIFAGSAAATVNSAIEGFVKAAASELLAKSIRINAVSPTVLEESVGIYGNFFPGFIPVNGHLVGQAYKKSALGIQTGKIIKVG